MSKKGFIEALQFLKPPTGITDEMMTQLKVDLSDARRFRTMFYAVANHGDAIDAFMDSRPEVKTLDDLRACIDAWDARPR